MRAMNKRPASLTPVLVCLMLLVLDVSVAVSGDEWEFEDDLSPQGSEEIMPSSTIPPSCVTARYVQSKIDLRTCLQMGLNGRFKSLDGGLISGTIRMVTGWTIVYNG